MSAEKITITQAQSLASDAGFTMTRPTLIKAFMQSGTYVRVGLRHYMDKEEFQDNLKNGFSYGKNNK